MPQMAPLMWTLLFIIFLTLLFFTFTKINFNKLCKPTKNNKSLLMKLEKNNSMYSMWKW